MSCILFASGYAGGIGPSTIDNVLVAVGRAMPDDLSATPAWIDMESSLRTLVVKNKECTEFADIFDLNKCMECIEIAKKYGF